MKKLIQLSLLSALLATSASFSYAETITLGSFATGTTASSLGFSSSETAMNLAGYTAFASPPATASTPPLQNGVAPTYALAADAPVWAAPLGNSTWVGYAPTAGPGGTNPPYGYYQFTTEFSATGGSNYAGTLDLMADDTAEVLLNGVAIVPFASLGSDVHCADNAASCTTPDVIALSGLTLLAGVDTNSLTFIVEQAGNEAPGLDPSGMDFTATLSGDAPAVPEPSSLVLLGTGLLSAAGMFSGYRRT